MPAATLPAPRIALPDRLIASPNPPTLLSPPAIDPEAISAAIEATATPPATPWDDEADPPEAKPKKAARLVGAIFFTLLLTAVLVVVPLPFKQPPISLPREAIRLVAKYCAFLPADLRLWLAHRILSQSFPFGRGLPWVVTFNLISIAPAAWLLRSRPKRRIIARIAGLEWDQNDFCRGWGVTGSTGAAKSASGIGRLMHELCLNCAPEIDPVTKQLVRAPWGGAVLDYKGELVEDLRSVFSGYGREDDIIVLRSRPPDAGDDWKPQARFNLLSDDMVPALDYAQTLCDTAMIAEGKKGAGDGNPFFPLAAKDAMTLIIKLCRAVVKLQIAQMPGLAPSRRLSPRLDRLYYMLMSREKFDDLLADAGLYVPIPQPTRPRRREGDEPPARYGPSEILQANTPEAIAVREAITLVEQSYFSIAGETFGSVQRTALNYLAPLMEKDILDVFSTDNTISIGDIDQGKVIVVSLPNTYQSQRLYIQIILSLLMFRHGKRRFDIPGAQRAQCNVLVLFADECQCLLNEEYARLDTMRGAYFTAVLSTQGVDSTYPVLGKEKATVLWNNVRSRLVFQSNSHDGAEADAKFLGEEPRWEKSYSRGGGGGSTSYKKEIKCIYEPYVLQGLKKFNCIVVHPNRKKKKIVLPPLAPDGDIQPWFRSQMEGNHLWYFWFVMRRRFGRLRGRVVRE